MAFYGHDPVPTIDADTAAAELEHGARMIDVGEPDDWFKGYIKGALLVEPELIDVEVKKLRGVPKLIVAARDQNLAEEVTAALREKHWDAVALDGGPGAWQKSGREVVHTR
ncbi:MAG TPA: rhodanese-like domain-containing protein [Acidimicrobiia bacterium]|jgi:rhodanese-related sulfurtransferase|nr:rhodanese-like domain-containing protein [Acidimicrobiia bacterium]